MREYFVPDRVAGLGIEDCVAGAAVRVQLAARGIEGGEHGVVLEDEEGEELWNL